MEALIQLSNLSIGYDKCPILKNISCSINSGELICLIGRNGEGKSTLIKTLCKLIAPIEGSIFINNQDLSRIDEKEFANQIGVVLTSKISITSISVKEFIAFGRYPYTNWLAKIKPEDEKIINDAIELCSIQPLIDRDFSSLSDGEKQKVNIARVIAQNTPIIILDEPTAHLDLVNNIEIFKLLKKLAHQHNKTIIFSTHHIDMALQLCDKIWVVNNHKFYTNTPKQTITEGIIDLLFENTDVKYNVVTNNFTIKN